MSVALMVERKIPRGNFPVCGLYEWEVAIGLRGIVIFWARLPLRLITGCAHRRVDLYPVWELAITLSMPGQ